jgi:hypothetical protein
MNKLRHDVLKNIWNQAVLIPWVSVCFCICIFPYAMGIQWYIEFENQHQVWCDNIPYLSPMLKQRYPSISDFPNFGIGNGWHSKFQQYIELTEISDNSYCSIFLRICKWRDPGSLFRGIVIFKDSNVHQSYNILFYCNCCSTDLGTV